MKINSSILAGASLIGTIIGAGVFAIPYVIVKSGVLISLFYFILLGSVVLLLHLLYGEIILRTQGRHQLSGYVKKYLGEKARKVLIVCSMLGALGALLIYIILGAEFLKIILPFNLSILQTAFIFWLLFIPFIFWGIKVISKLEFFLSAVLLIAFFIIIGFCLPQIKIANFQLVDTSYWLLPFGIFLFSLVGWHAIPEIMDVLDKKKHLKNIIIVSFLVCVLVYLLFGIAGAGVIGKTQYTDIFLGLAVFLGPGIIYLGGIVGLLAIATSFIITANFLKHLLDYDCKLPTWLAIFLTIAIPFILFLLGFREFLPIISLVGVFMGLAEGTAIILVYQKAKKSGDRIPEYTVKTHTVFLCFIVLILFFGVLVEVINFLKV